MFTGLAYAQGAQPTSSPLGGISALFQFFPILLIFVVFYLLLLRPQQKRQSEHRKMLDELKKGDFVMTTGGIYGQISGLNDKRVSLKVAENLTLEVSREHIATLSKPLSLPSSPREGKKRGYRGKQRPNASSQPPESSKES